MDRSRLKIAASFFDAGQTEAIRSAVAAAESRSSGEIAVIVVPESERYREAEKLGALLLAGLVSVVISVASGHVSIWSYIPLVCLLFFPSLWLFRLCPLLKLSFAGPRRQIEAVRERALATFYEKELHRTREETGILIFISLLERKVWILADRGINERIKPGHWHGLARKLAGGVRAGRAAETLCEVISECGDELARHFPRRVDDVNELPDAPLTLDRR
ncbi:MAG TPA: hypothetical protein VJ550_14240 [Geomonas sp.]|nr:hypothetical protein [Geomonas sp.]